MTNHSKNLSVKSYGPEHVKHCLADGANLFALLDACDDLAIQNKVPNFHSSQCASLYSGGAQRELASIAPYLAKVDDQLAEWIEAEIQSTPWGYYLCAGENCSLQDLRRHLRRHLLVQAPDGQKLYFRFYDPRVLKMFLESANADELAHFFGPVKFFLTLANTQVTQYECSQETAANVQIQR